MQVRLLIDGEGMWDTSWRAAMSSGSVLVHVGEWLPPVAGLQAWVHFVPCRADGPSQERTLERNLEQTIEWALRHPDADCMAERARALYSELRSPGHAMRLLVDTLADTTRTSMSQRQSQASQLSARDPEGNEGVARVARPEEAALTAVPAVSLA